jgi:hypothetical protein
MNFQGGKEIALLSLFHPDLIMSAGAGARVPNVMVFASGFHTGTQEGCSVSGLLCHKCVTHICKRLTFTIKN